MILSRFPLAWQRVVLFLNLLLLSHSVGWANGDFPNHFLELVPGSHGPVAAAAAVDTTHAEGLVEQALFSVLRRLQIPHVDGVQADGSPRIVLDGFFAKLEARVKAKDPEARVYIGGGVVRSLLGYLYKKVYQAKEKNPTLTTEAVLTSIIRGEKTKGGAKPEIPSLTALGVGSDLDIYVDLSPAGKIHESSIVAETTEFINAAEKAAHLDDVHSKLKYSVVPIGDVKDYHAQLARTMSQGGSSLDWLAFPLTSASGTRMRLPEGHPDILKKFILGEYDYLPPRDPSALSDPDKQTVRGLRAYLEIPFLHLSREGQVQMKKELAILVARGAAGLSPGAIEQFEKMVRNARFGGAYNRFYDPTPTAEEDRELERMVHQISQNAVKDAKRLPLIPEFLVHRDPRKKDEADGCGLRKAGLLMPEEDFKREYTDEGKLYHGTQAENVLPIIRNGFVVSSEGQGLAALGRGVYSTRDRSVAAVYGTPIEFRVKDGVSLRVLDWKKVAEDPAIQKLEAEAKGLKIDPFKYLAERCGVDFIVNEYVLIQNSGAIQLPRNINEIIRLYSSKVLPFVGLDLHDSHLDVRELPNMLQFLKEYIPLQNLGRTLGLRELPTVSPVSHWVTELLKNPNPKVRSAAAIAFTAVERDKEALRSISGLGKALAEALQDADSGVRMALLSGLRKMEPEEIEVQQAILSLTSDPVCRPAAIEVLRILGPRLHRDLYSGAVAASKEGLKDADLIVRLQSLHTIRELRPKDLEVQRAVASLLKDPEAGIRATALEVLVDLEPQPDSEVYHTLVEDSKKALRDVDPQVRLKGFSILKKLKVRSREIQRAVASLLKDPDAKVRAGAFIALVDLQPRPEEEEYDEGVYQELMDAVKARLEDPDGFSRHEIFQAIEQLKPSGSGVQLALAELLKDSDISVRFQAARALVACRPLDRRVHAGVIELLNHRNPSIRWEASQVLEKLRPAQFVVIRHCRTSDDASPLSSSQMRTLRAIFDLNEDEDTKNFGNFWDRSESFSLDTALERILDGEASNLSLVGGNKHIGMEIERSGYLYRSIRFTYPSSGKLKLYNKDVPKLLTAFYYRQEVVAQTPVRCGVYRCIKVDFSATPRAPATSIVISQGDQGFFYRIYNGYLHGAE